MPIERKHHKSPRTSTSNFSLPSSRGSETFGGVAAREESFPTDQESPIMAAGRGSSDDGTTTAVGPFGGENSFTAELGGLSPA